MKENLSIFGKKILTTDPEKRIGLYAIRYLGRAGADITSINNYLDNKKPIGFYSKYLNHAVNLNNNEFYNGLEEFLRNNAHKYDILIPIDISKMLCVLDTQHKYGIPGKHLLPSRESIVTANDKSLLYSHLKRFGILSPQTLSNLSLKELDQKAKHFKYPCIIKFRGDSRKTHWKPDERYTIVNTPGQLIAEYRRMHDIEAFPIIQEFIHGRGYGYFALFDKDRKLKAEFCHKRIREYPLSGGPSSCCESYYNKELIAIGRKVLDSLEWRGLAMVEFKYDEHAKIFYVLEVNGRYWGSLPLAVESGVNFPVLHALSALEIDYKPVLQYNIGVRVRFLHNDILAIFSQIQKSHSGLARLRLALQIFFPFVKDGLLAMDDVAPVVKSVLKIQ
jgi:predicted ATP-grasp superfamily ATP-dependent carboligase